MKPQPLAYRLLALAGLFYCLGSPAPVLAQCSGTPNANTVCAGGTSGGAALPTFRTLVPADIPAGGGTSLTVGSGGTPVTGTPAAAGAAPQVLYNNSGQLNSTASSAGSTTTFLRGDMTWQTPPGGSGSPGGAANSVQYNNAGAFGGVALTANQLIGSLSGSLPTAIPVTNCVGGANALNWAAGTGFSCNTISGGSATAITVGTTTIGSGTSGAILYNNAGVLGNLAQIPFSNIANVNANSLLGNSTGSATNPSNVAVPSCSGTTNALTWTSGTGFGCNTITAGSGTVTTFSAGTLSPLFTTTVTNATTTPNLAFTLSNAAANTVFSNWQGSTAAPQYNTWPSCSGSTSALQYLNGTGVQCATSFLVTNVQGQGPLTGGASVTTLGLTTGNITVDCSARPLQSITASTSAWSITAPGSDGSCIVKVTNPPSAVIPTMSGFSVASACLVSSQPTGTGCGDPMTATNAAAFSIFIWRVGGTSGYRIAAHQ